MHAAYVGEELRGCRWVGVPFAGGMSELMEIDASSIVVSDLHRHVINLALTIRDRRHNELVRMLRDTPFHPDMLARAQAFCKKNEPRKGADYVDVAAAYWYFVCVWMGRSHKAGTVDEFNGGLSRRWNANGGDSNVRYRSAIRALASWHRLMQRCSFDVLDVFEFLEACLDAEGHAIYCDPPWPKDGDKYRHAFTVADHRRLAAELGRFRTTRVVVRLGDHPLVRELYPESVWTWRRITSRTQTNSAKAEALILNGPSRAADKGGLFA
jgi:site-specific DNA-adenine methylase